MLNIMHIYIVVEQEFLYVRMARGCYVYAAATQRGKLKANKLANTGQHRPTHVH